MSVTKIYIIEATRRGYTGLVVGGSRDGWIAVKPIGGDWEPESISCYDSYPNDPFAPIPADTQDRERRKTR